MKLEQLHLRAFGGGDVAADPIADDGDYWWPEGRPAPGAREALDLFMADMRSGTDTLAWLVLLGGPGNGKSALLKRLVADHASGSDNVLRPVGPDLSKAIHHRTYDYVTDMGHRVRLVNDATIKTQGATVGKDFSYALNERAHLLMSVNRGVLVEDLRQAGEKQFEREMIELLISAGGDGAGCRAELVEVEPVPIDDVPYLVQLRLTVDGQDAVLRVVSLDCCSLLEPRPEVEVVTADGATMLHGKAYRMAEFADTRVRLETPAGELLADVAKALQPMTPANGEAGSWDVDWNPIAANVASLRSSGVRAGILRVLRTAEIMEGRLFTFRELWGTIALLCVGPATSDQISLGFVEEQMHSYEQVSGLAIEPAKRLEHLLALSQFRFSQALFAEPPHDIRGRNQPTPMVTPVTERLRRADPVLDATAGVSTDLMGGWATPVLDALEAARFNGQILNRLRELSSPEFSAMVTPFDLLLEATLLEWWDSGVRDSQIHHSMAWFGRYVLRLYALAEGIPAFGADISAWTSFWTKASGGHVDDAMVQRIRRLIAPSLASGGGAPEWVVLPVFGSRVEPLRALSDDARLVARFKPADLEIRASTKAERIVLTVYSGGEELVSLDFDYPLLREAMAHSSVEAGATELGAQCTPRLERARASLLVGRGPASRWAIVDSSGVSGLYLTSQEHVDGP